MKTLEFKLDLDKSQQLIIDGWLDDLRWVWNEGLALLLESHQFKYYKWLFKQLDKIGVDKEGIRLCRLEFSKSNAFAARCPIAAGKSDNLHPICSLPIPGAPRLKGASYMGLSGWITKQRYPESEALNRLPMVYAKGTLKNLSEAWKAYTDKGRANSHAVKFKAKRRGECLDTLYTLQPETISIKDGKISAPGANQLGRLKVVNKDILKRWPAEIEPRTLKICKRPSGYYLQLTGEIEAEPVKPSTKVCGLDVGLQYIYSDDAGHTIKPPKYYRTSEKRLRRLQRKLERQVDLNGTGSANQEKTKKKIARTHEKTRLQRRSFNHKLSTYLVRTYDAIAVEDIKIANLMRRPKPKKREAGNGYERNGAAAKSGLNKSFADAGLGQLLTMIEVKAKAHGRTFTRVAPHYTSQDCPKCGHRQKKALSQRTHLCAKCGYTEKRDTAAAINIKAKAFGTAPLLTAAPLQTSQEATPLVLGKVKPLKDGDKPSVQEEPAQAGHPGDAGTTLNCADGGMFQRGNSQNVPQTAALPMLNLNCNPTEIRATSELFTQIDLQPIANDLTEQITSRKRKRGKRAAHSDIGTQMELDLWGTG